MKIPRSTICLVLIVAAGMAVAVAAKERLAFSGGPEGGTFQYFSNGISSRLSKTLADVDISNMASAGSLENLRRVNSGDTDFGIVYSGDIYLGRHGRLTQDTNTYTQVYALAKLYGAPAHLVVLNKSDIKTLAGLEGKRVAVGGAGSGAASAAQRFFTSLGLWDKIKVEFLGYGKAAEALGDGLIDAFWVLAGFPNASVIQAAASNEIVLLDVATAAQESSFLEDYPFYTPVTIPAGTYPGVDYDTHSFEDLALWVAGQHLNTKTVEESLARIFSKQGLAYMIKVKSTAKAMSVESALHGVITPIHPGAEKFWRQHGLTITEAHTAR